MPSGFRGYRGLAISKRIDESVGIDLHEPGGLHFVLRRACEITLRAIFEFRGDEELLPGIRAAQPERFGITARHVKFQRNNFGCGRLRLRSSVDLRAEIEGDPNAKERRDLPPGRCEE